MIASLLRVYDEMMRKMNKSDATILTMSRGLRIVDKKAHRSLHDIEH